MKKVTLSVGISAYNEEANIEHILHMLLSQKEESYLLKEIIIALDGCGDKTKEKILQVNDKRIRMIVGTERKGKAYRLNQILASFTCDALVVVDADVVISDQKLLSRLVGSSNLSKDGLVSINVTPLPAKTFFEHCIQVGVFIVKDIAKRWNHGKNYLSFRGCLLAVDKEFARKLRMPLQLVNDDTYFYFSSLAAGYTPRYISDCFVYYKSPTTFKDHLNQSSRYRNSREEMESYFSLDFNALYSIPLFPRIFAAVKYCLLMPWYFIPYCGVLLVTMLNRDKKITGLWNIATSTK